MSEYVRDLMAEVKAKNPTETEFHQAVEEVLESLDLVFEEAIKFIKYLNTILYPIFREKYITKMDMSFYNGIKNYSISFYNFFE